jgi:hypothetical protein
MGVCRIYKGKLMMGQQLLVKDSAGKVFPGKITKLFTFEGLSKIDSSEGVAGDIVMIAGIPDIFIGQTSAWLPAICLMVIHLLIDLTKLYLQTERSKNTWFVLDQAFHLISILVIWKLAYPALAGQSYTNTELKIWLYATAIVLLTNVSALVIQMMMRRWSEIIEKFTKNSLPNAGKYIGMLERSFILLFILTNHWEAIGFLLTAKSVFRFGDLNEAKEIKLTEYVLIGTLISFGMAILTGVAVQERDETDRHHEVVETT